MKVGIVGKGGVGKTTTSSLIARALVERGRRVVAVDTDSNPNLGMSLGMTFEEIEAIPQLPRALIVGAKGDLSAEEVIDEYGRTTPFGVTLISAIKVNEAGAGCTCGGHASVRSFLGDVLESQADVTLVDMEAGLEHLSRSGGTLAYADILVVIMEPSRKSIITAARTIALAEELGIPRTVGVGNKANLPDDVEFFEKVCAEYGVPLAGVIPYDMAVVDADRAGIGMALGTGEAVRQAIEGVVDYLDEAVPVPVA
ncbi:carbon monoxide dehydrogenase accessory protein CooC [soil metagenome]|jgi:CO dehydrogenase maturation factor